MELMATGSTGLTEAPSMLCGHDNNILGHQGHSTTLQQTTVLGKRIQRYARETSMDQGNFANKRFCNAPVTSIKGLCNECSIIPWGKIDKLMSDKPRFPSEGKLVIEVGKRYRNVPPSTNCLLCRQLHAPWIEPFLEELEDADWKKKRYGDRIHIFRHLRHLTHVNGHKTSMNILRKYETPYHIAVVPFGDKWEAALQTHIGSRGMVVVIPEGCPESEIFAPQEITPKFDPGLALSWLDCCKKHKTLCSPKCPPVKGMKLIDCNTGLIQLRRPTDKYVALSYVWGAPISVKKPELELPGAQKNYGEELGNIEAKIPGTINTNSQRSAQSMPSLKLERCLSSQTSTIVVDTTNSGLVESEADSTSRLPSNIPLTIRDAIQVTKALDFQFLWVDSYCINQESEEDKKEQCSRMGEIYAGAQVTILGMGSDSNYGLPGVSSRARLSQQQSTEIGRYKFVSTMIDPHISISQAKWSTRGWTYQEGLFSTRRLFFTDYQTYFECNAMNCVETFKSNLKILHIETGQRLRAFHRAGKFVCGNSNGFSHLNVKDSAKNHRKVDNIHRCQYHIQEYTKRELTQENDMLNAFAGIARFYSKSSARIASLAGIPVPSPIANLSGEHLNHLSYALAWAHKDAKPQEPRSMHTRSQTDITGTQSNQIPRENPRPRRRLGFPSWSWSGWFGEIELRKDLPYCWTSYLSSVKIQFPKQTPRDCDYLWDFDRLSKSPREHYRIKIVEKLLAAEELRFDAHILNHNNLEFWDKSPRMSSRQIPSKTIHVRLSTNAYSLKQFQTKLMTGELKCLVIGTYGKPRNDILKAIQVADGKAPKARVGRIDLFEREDPDAVVCLVVRKEGQISYRVGLLKIEVESTTRECVIRQWCLGEKESFILR